jgi:hypothetical protein
MKYAMMLQRKVVSFTFRPASRRTRIGRETSLRRQRRSGRRDKKCPRQEHGPGHLYEQFSSTACVCVYANLSVNSETAKFHSSLVFLPRTVQVPV